MDALGPLEYVLRGSSFSFIGFSSAYAMEQKVGKPALESNPRNISDVVRDLGTPKPDCDC
jgi:hypothetical protein